LSWYELGEAVTTDFAIIIPYFQTRRGLLRRAVQSVLKQVELDDARLIVVDDGSPLDPLAEIGDFIAAGPRQLVLLRRENGGAGAARNTALDYLERETRLVAFLDSDDAWQPGHLAKMRAAFAAGADFYFSDFRRPGSAQTAFERMGFGRGNGRPLEPTRAMYWYKGDLLDLVQTNCPFGTCSVAYRIDGIESVRFDPSFRYACEDRLFFASISHAIKAVAFTTSADIDMGTGINIFASATWGTSKALVRVLDTARFHTILGRDFRLAPSQKARNLQALSSLDKEFCENAIVSFIKGDLGRLETIKLYMRLRSPSFLRALPAAALGLAKDRLRAPR
jgi:succinoglycan biosynthesis protein ExoW